MSHELTNEEKVNLMRLFLRGASMSALSQMYCCRIESIADVIRQGTEQAMALLGMEDDPETQARIEDVH